MTSTTFRGPVKIGDAPVGNPQLETVGYVRLSKVVPLTSGTRTIISFPANTLITACKAVVTSAFSGVDTAASAMNVNFGTSADPTGYGVINVSGNGTGAGAMGSLAVVSGAILDAGGTMILTLSAASTTTFTAGGVRALVDYIVTE